MKHYILYDKNGKILQNISTSTDILKIPLLEGELLEISNPIIDIALKKVVNGQIVDSSPEPLSYDFNRYLDYPIIREQLGMLWHDIDQGFFGDNAKNSKFYKAILDIKTKYPKT